MSVFAFAARSDVLQLHCCCCCYVPFYLVVWHKMYNNEVGCRLVGWVMSNGDDMYRLPTAKYINSVLKMYF